MEEPISFKKQRIVLGYEEVKPFEVSEHLNNFCDDTFNKISLDVDIYPFKNMKPEVVMSLGKSFLESKISTREISYIKPALLNGVIAKSRSNKIVKPTFLCDLLRSKISPYSLPVFFTEKDDSTVGLTEILDVTDNMKDIRRMKVIFSYIKMKERSTICGVGDYVHEIIHTQIEGTGVIKNYYDSEILSIFFELLYGICLDGGNGPLSYTCIINRLADMVRCRNLVNKYDINDCNAFDLYISSAKYLNSIVKALALLECYYYGNDLSKSSMMLNIQSVIDGIMTVEDLLNYYHLDMDNCIDKAKGFI